MRYYKLLSSASQFPLKNQGRFSAYLDTLGQYNRIDHIIEPSPADTHWCMYSKSALTDLITIIGFDGYLISEQMRSVLEAHRLPPYKWIPGTIEHRKSILNQFGCFYVPVLPSTPAPYDFTRTEFYVLPAEESTRPKDKPFFVQDIKDAQKQELYLLEHSKVYLTQEVAQYDLFRVVGLHVGLYVSERLKSALLDAQITGIVFLECEVFNGDSV